MVRKDDETDLVRAKRRERDSAEKQDDVRQIKEIERQVKRATSHLTADETTTTTTTATADASRIQSGTPTATTITEFMPQRSETDAPIAFSFQKELPPRHEVLHEGDEKEAKKPKLEAFGVEEPSTTATSPEKHIPQKSALRLAQ